MKLNDTMSEKNKRENRERWERKAEALPHKPDPVYHKIVPELIRELGQCLFPIPRRRKGWNWPHHLEEYRYKASDEIFNAYLEAGSGYGIACAGGLIVVDIDDSRYAEYISKKLPESAWQISGSREGYHIFYLCENQDKRINLRIPIPSNHLAAEGYGEDMRISSGPHSGYRHIGEVKADPHGYVVGPGSVHPSGNTYGPLYGDEITEIEQDELKESLSVLINEHTQDSKRRRIIKERRDKYKSSSSETRYKFFELDADDVVPWLEPDNRVPHPGHGSTSGQNFMKNEDRETFTCWRHDYGSGVGCGLNPRQLLAQIETDRECDDVRSSWPVIEDSKVHGDGSLLWHSWKRAVKDGLVSYNEVPYTVAKAYAIEREIIGEDDGLMGSLYWDTVNAIKCEMEEPHLPKQKPEEI